MTVNRTEARAVTFVPESISDLLQEYDELAEAVANATNTFHQSALSRWLSFLDRTPALAGEVARLEKVNDFDAWYKALEDRQRGHGLGSTSLNFPSDQEAALGIQISLFRRMAERQIRAEIFAHIYVAPHEQNIDRGLSEFARQVFTPAATALRRHLRGVADSVPPDIGLLVPASDRTVLLDHNSADYIDTVQALDKVEQVVQQSNDYQDGDDKEQRIAELGAGRRLLQAIRVRADVVVALLYRGLLYLAKKFADVAIGAVAVAALAALGRLTGFW
jgi:hypothetical protein